MGPRLGSVAGLETGVEQQTMGQGWLEHRSKARRAGPEAELVTSSKDGCVPGSPVVIEDCRSCVVPKLWLDHGHTATLPPGSWGRSRARRQEVDTARELGDNRETRRETDTGGERKRHSQR